MTATFASLEALDAALAAAGHHPLTPWWKDTLSRFYGHPTARTLVARVGRGGAKSHTSVKVSLNEILAGDWKVPPGERHLWAYVSVSKEEAAQRLLLIENFLRCLGIPFERSGDQIHLSNLPLGWKVAACQVNAVSGFRCIGASLDELAKWTAGGDAANPAAEVAASVAAMSITHPGARRLLISSPLGNLDFHHERFELGDTAEQVTAYAPSWVANPAGITEEQTRKQEPIERVWRREYLAVPQASASSAFDPDTVARAFRQLPGGQWQRPICVVDASSGGGDAFAWAIVGFCYPTPPEGVSQYVTVSKPRTVHTRDAVTSKPIVIEDHSDCFEEPARDGHGRLIENPEWHKAQTPQLVFWKVDAVEGRFKGTVSASAIVDRIAEECRRSRVSLVVGDQREAFFLASEFRRHGLMFREMTWTNASKVDSVRRIREHLGRGTLVLPPEREKLKRELLNYAERITASGAITYSARGAGHDDEAALVMTAAMAELERLVPGSPLYGHMGRTEVSGR